jgi:hypothetical protein
MFDNRRRRDTFHPHGSMLLKECPAALLSSMKFTFIPNSFFAFSAKMLSVGVVVSIESPGAANHIGNISNSHTIRLTFADGM